MLINVYDCKTGETRVEEISVEEIEEIEEIEREPTVEEKLINLKTTDTEVELAIAEIYEMILGGN